MGLILNNANQIIGRRADGTSDSFARTLAAPADSSYEAQDGAAEFIFTNLRHFSRFAVKVTGRVDASDSTFSLARDVEGDGFNTPSPLLFDAQDFVDSTAQVQLSATLNTTGEPVAGFFDLQIRTLDKLIVTWEPGSVTAGDLQVIVLAAV
jgi:hypothetical protein